MAKLRLNALKIITNCSEGDFGAFFKLESGLNILRARNSTGKSSIMNSILYCLGMEQLLGGQNEATMKPVLRDVLKHNGETLPVLESIVELEIVNALDETITVSRWVKSDSVDTRLVRVHFGAILTKNEQCKSKDFYVHLPGAAVEESGFHQFLASFIGWDLPQVPSFDGKDRILYMQTLFPLFFIEQIKGWSGFYNTLPSNFGIRDMSKRAIEFTWALDVLNNARKREELKVRKAIIPENWRSILSQMTDVATKINGFLSNAPQSPDLSSDVQLLVYDSNQKVVDLESRIFNLKEELVSPPVKMKRISEVIAEEETRLSKLEWEVSNYQSATNSLRTDLHLEESNRDALERDLEDLQTDLVKNKEARKLYMLGTTMELAVADGLCPTCHQHLKDTLLPQDLDVEPMGIDENIKYITEQIHAIEFAVAQSALAIDRKRTRLRSVENQIKVCRQEMRVLKTELNEDPRMPSRQEVEKYIELKSLVSLLEEAKSNMEKLSDRLDAARESWKEYLIDKKQVGDAYFSELDREKLDYAQDNFRTYATKFGYHSGDIDDISISEDKYMPTIKGYDIKFDSSASDHIRLIWAYACTVLQVSRHFGANHPMLLIMDEPGQQQMAPDSQKELFKLLSQIDGQKLVASSLALAEIEEITDGLSVNVVDLGDEYIIKPIV